jgi:hypothetical protein
LFSRGRSRWAPVWRSRPKERGEEPGHRSR